MDRNSIKASLGIVHNKNGGIYIQGESHGYAKKLEVAYALRLAKLDNNSDELRLRGGVPNMSAIGRLCGVGPEFVRKISDELLLHNRVLRTHEIYANRDVPRGAGSKSMDEFDMFILLQLYTGEPGRSLKSYVDELEDYTGKRVGKSTISRVFLESFPVKAGFVTPNLVPYDKFSHKNEATAWEYLYFICKTNLIRVKFGDEKSLKGQELYPRKVRKDPLTGLAPDVMVDSDFRNTHSITGIISYSPDVVPFWYSIHSETNNADTFLADIEAAIADGFLLPGDILGLDNAPIHVGKCNKVLGDWLWKHHGVFLLFLPPRTPEWNPIEPMWHTMVKRIHAKNLTDLRERYGVDCVAHAAAEVMEEFTHDDVYNHYMHCYGNL